MWYINKYKLHYLIIVILIILAGKHSANAQAYQYNYNYLPDSSLETIPYHDNIDSAGLYYIYKRENKLNKDSRYWWSPFSPYAKLVILYNDFKKFKLTNQSFCTGKDEICMYARTGNAFGAVVPFYYFISGAVDPANGIIPKIKVDYKKRDYLNAGLKQTLTKNKYYYVYQYVQQPCCYNFKTNALTMRFNSDSVVRHTANLSPTQTFFDAIFPLPDTLEGVMYKKNCMPTDTLTWEKMAFVYKANGNENFLSIGNYLPLNKTIVEFNPQNYINVYEDCAMFLCFDDVSVYELGDLDDPIKVKDTIINKTCNTFTMRLHAELNPKAGSFLWSTGETTQDITIKKEGVYILSFFVADTVYKQYVNIAKPNELATYNNTTTIYYQFKNIPENKILNIPNTLLPNTINIYSATGALVLSEKNITNKLSLENLASGMYYFKYTDACNIYNGSFLINN